MDYRRVLTMRAVLLVGATLTVRAFHHVSQADRMGAFLPMRQRTTRPADISFPSQQQQSRKLASLLLSPPPQRRQPAFLHVSTIGDAASTGLADSVQLEESFPDREVDVGVIVRSAARAFTDDDQVGERELCSGYLVEKCVGDDDARRGDKRRGRVVCEAAISETDSDRDEALQLEGATQVLDSLFMHYLTLEKSNTVECTFELHVQKGYPELGRPEGTHSISYRAALMRGFRPSLSEEPTNENESIEDSGLIAMTFDYNLGVRNYSEIAFDNRGTSTGAAALAILGLLSARRDAYRFSTLNVAKKSLIASYPQLVPPQISSEILSTFEKVVENGWLATTPDSVDGDPTLHLILVSKGRLLFTEERDLLAEEDELPGLMDCGRKLSSLIEPIIYGKLLPKVRDLTNSSTVEVCDVFMRRYSENVTVQPKSDGNKSEVVTRRSIAGHYDFDMFATSVMAFDDVAADGKNGMYTTLQPSLPLVENDFQTGCGTSNHLALRRFFPLSTGDAVIHDWSVLHGVDIQEGCTRTSLIVWFSDGQPVETGLDFLPPWLENPEGDDDIGLFLAAGARSRSAKQSAVEDADIEDYDPSFTMTNSNDPLEMYIRSASLGNAFALFTLGAMCMQNELAPSAVNKVIVMLERMRPVSHLHTSVGRIGNLAGTISGDFRQQYLSLPEFALSSSENSQMKQSGPVARRLWLEAAMRGEAKAQAALGDTLMESAVPSLFSGGIVPPNEDLLVMAAVMFSLAAQQEHPGAVESLSKLLDMAYSLLYVDRGKEEEFSSSQILKMAQAASVLNSKQP